MREKNKSVPTKRRKEAKLAIPNLEAPTTTQRLNLSRCQHKEKKSVQKVRPSKKKKKKRKLMDADYHQAMIINFKDEMIVDILSKLPVQSLLRFKCISKVWKTLISEPYFKMKHQNHAMNFKKLLVGQWFHYTNSKFRFYCSPLSSAQLVEDVEELVCPTSYEPPMYNVWCSYNGLVLLSIGEHLLLWNPSTRESIELPYSKTIMGYRTFGLGYDTTSDDYKILKFHHAYMEILALKSGCWRKILNNRTDPLPNFFNPLDPFAFVHGAFHWIGYQNRLSLDSLSISDEVCGNIQLLEPMRKLFDGYDHKYGVAVLREMLCFYYANMPSEETTCKLWVMKEYGIKESWIQLYTIRETCILLERPLYIFDDGEVLLSYRCGYHEHPLWTSKGPYGLGCLWSVDNAMRQAITYSESMISPKLLI